MERITRKRTGKVLQIPEPKVDETIVEAVKDFPDYDHKDASTFVGSKQYWESVFKDETNRSPELHEKFGKLHKDIVDMVIRFCEENGLEDVDWFNVSATGLKDSYGYHEWTPGTDSPMRMRKLKNEDGFWVQDDDNFLYEF